MLGLLVGLGVTEAVFRHRDGGAYPLVNVYEPDARRGVRLTPGSATRVTSPDGNPTSIRVNRDGYRGADWPAPSALDVLVVGDSMSFGLGVEEHEALPARLHAALPGAPPVLDASVPTHGPPEYLVTMEQHLSSRRPGTVVVVVNLINDLVELDAPNITRHTAVDGFAARVEATRGRASSPLRRRAIQTSHAAFALFRWSAQRAAESANLPPPEDGMSPLLALAMRVAAESEALDDHARSEAKRAADLLAAEGAQRAAERDIVRLVREHRALVAGTEIWRREWDAYLRSDGEPGDEIFQNYFIGCAPPPPEWYGRGRYSQTVRFAGARIKKDVERQLAEMAHGLSPARRSEIEAAFARRTEAARALEALPKAPLPAPPARAPLPTATFFAQLAALAQSHGSKLVVVIAPLDAQTSIEARRRRLLTDPEAEALDALSKALTGAAREAGAVGVDAAPALREAGERAFLRDGHLSPKGHDLVARAIAAALAPAGGSG